MIDLNDILIVVGASTAFVGAWLISPPALLVVGGLLILVAGVARGLSRGRR